MVGAKTMIFAAFSQWYDPNVHLTFVLLYSPYGTALTVAGLYAGVVAKYGFCLGLPIPLNL